MDGFDMKQEILKAMKNRKEQKHYFFCEASSSGREDIESMRDFLEEEMGFELTAFKQLDNLVYIETKDQKSAKEYEDKLSSYIRNMNSNTLSTREKLSNRIPHIEYFAIDQVDEDKSVAKRLRKSHGHESYEKWNVEEEAKLELTRDFIRKEGAEADEKMIHIFADYLEKNFEITNNITFKTLLQGCFKEVKENVQEEGYLREAKIIDLYQFKLDEMFYNDIFPKTRLRDSYEENYKRDISDVVENLISKNTMSGIKITKKDLLEKLGNYVEFDQIDESKDYVPFYSYKLKVPSEGSDVDFMLSNTVLGRDYNYNKGNFIKEVISSFSVYAYNFCRLAVETRVEEEIEDFYLKEDNQKVHIDDVLPRFVEQALSV